MGNHRTISAWECATSGGGEILRDSCLVACVKVLGRRGDLSQVRLVEEGRQVEVRAVGGVEGFKRGRKGEVVVLEEGVEDVSMGRRVRRWAGPAVGDSCRRVVDQLARAVRAYRGGGDVGLKPVQDESERRVLWKPSVRVDHEKNVRSIVACDRGEICGFNCNDGLHSRSYRK